MALDSSKKFKTASTNGCLMDSDLPSIDPNPSEVLSDSWIPKEYTGATFTGTGFSECSGKISFIPVQVASTKDVSIDAQGYYVGKFSGTLGGFGQTDHVVELKGLCGEGQYVYLKNVSIMCTTDDQGIAVSACLVPDETGLIKSNALKFRTINADETSATKNRTFKVYIHAVAEISNTDFGIGELFPKIK